MTPLETSRTGKSYPELRRVLETIGLSGTELRTYEFLLQAGVATPTMVARETNQSRGRIYETLRLLVDKGLAREEPTRPVQYIPVPFAEVVAVALGETNRQAQLLRRVYSAVVEAGGLPTGRPLPVPLTRPQDVSVLSGRPALVSQLRRLAKRAHESFRAGGEGRASALLAALPELLEELRQAQQRGALVEIYVRPSPENAPDRAALARALGAEAVLDLSLPRPMPLFAAVADEEALLAVLQPDDASPDGGDDVVLVAKSPPFHRLAQDHFSGSQVSGADGGGGALASYVSTEREQFRERYKEALAKAQVEVVGMGPKGWSQFLSAGWETLIGRYEEAKRQGVSFRGVTEDSSEERTLMEPFRRVWDIRVASWVPAWLVVVDHRELFQAYPRKGEAPIRVRYSSDPDDVRFYEELFERIWSQSKPLGEAPAEAQAR